MTTMLKLNVIVWLTTAFVFALLAGIFGVVLLFVGAKNALFFAIIFSIALLAIQWYVGPSIIKFVTGAREVSEKEEPWLHSVVAELAARAGIPKPKVCIVKNRAPNAFAFGRTPRSSYVAVHTGLLETLEKPEIESVLAHEIAHIAHNDVFVITAASALPVMLYYAIIAMSDRERSPLFVFAGAMAAQFLGRLAVLWLSRTREYFADARAAEEKGALPLARALAKITYANAFVPQRAKNEMMSAFYFSSNVDVSRELIEKLEVGNKEELKKALEREESLGFLELFSTHPSTVKRLKALLGYA